MRAFWEEFNKAIAATKELSISDVIEASLRFYRKRFENLRDLVGLDTLNSAAANFCWALIRPWRRVNA